MVEHPCRNIIDAMQTVVYDPEYDLRQSRGFKFQEKSAEQEGNIFVRLITAMMSVRDHGVQVWSVLQL